MADKVDSGDYTEETKYRRAIALALLKQGFGQHGRAGGIGVAADAVNGLVSGYMMRGADLDEKEADNKVAAALVKLPGLSAPAAAPVVPSSTPTAAAAPTAEPSDFRSFVEKQEGFNPRAYPDYKQTSIGFGTRGQPGETISREEAGKRLDVELSKARQLVQGQYPGLSPGREDALTDLTYNAGNKWMDSGLGKAVAAGDWQDAQRRFLQYNQAGGQTLPGLANRRAAMAPRLLDAGAPPPVQVAQAGGAMPGIPGVSVEPPQPMTTGSLPPTPNTTPGAPSAAPLPAIDVTAEPPPAANPGAPATRTEPAFSPAMRDSIVELMKNRQTRPLGLQMYMETMKAAQPSYDFQVVGDHLVKIDKKRGSAEIVPGLEASKDKPPQGFEWLDKNDKAKGLRAIPGGPGEHLQEAAAGRLAMMDAARPGLAEARKVFERNWGTWDAIKNAAANAPGGDIGLVSGEIGQARRSVQIAIEAGLRMMTGAAAPKEEVASYMDKFMPGVRDSVDSAKQKLDALDAFMGKAEALMTRGRSSTPGTAGMSGGGWSIKAVP